jgi:hypothetical protein
VDLYEVWVCGTTGWWLNVVCDSLERAKTWAQTLEGNCQYSDYRIVPAPIMTAQAWVEMGEV